jgi:hypothetical protein
MKVSFMLVVVRAEWLESKQSKAGQRSHKGCVGFFVFAEIERKIRCGPRCRIYS